MRRITLLLLTTVFFLPLLACEGDFRQRAIGENHEIIVVMDESLHEGATAEALNETFGRVIETLPGQAEMKYTLRFQDFQTNEELENIRKRKNIIFAGPIDDETNVSSFIRALLTSDVEERVRAEESFAFPLKDHWYRDQWALVLTSTGDLELADKIYENETQLVDSALEVELARWEQDIFRRAEQVELSDSLWERFGWKVRIQHDYIPTVDTLNVVSFRRSYQDNDRWMWGWWEDDFDTPEVIDQHWINTKRDSLMERYVQGTREGSYVTTEYRRAIETREVEREDRLIGWETLGTWRMTNDFMGGPFVNFTYYDPETERVFMIEYGQFAPRYAKRRFVQQFRAMGRTFQADSTFSAEDYPEEYLTAAEALNEAETMDMDD